MPQKLTLVLSGNRPKLMVGHIDAEHIQEYLAASELAPVGAQVEFYHMHMFEDLGGPVHVEKWEKIKDGWVRRV